MNYAETIPNEVKTYYFIGIGGIGMSALARILLAQGHNVLGSDVAKTDVTKGLENIGIHVNYTQEAKNIKDGFIVVSVDSVSDGNEEYNEAVRRKLTIYKRPELLSLLEKTKDVSIAISGAHGKTTTCTMVSHLLTEVGQDPTCAVGGIVPQWQSNGRVGAGKQFVYEACEAYGNLVMWNPTHLIVTNIDRDHLEVCNNDYEQFKEYYITYMNRVAADEKHFVLANYDDAGIQSVVPKLHKNIKYFSLEKSNRDDSRIIAKGGNVKATQDGTGFEVELFGAGGKHEVFMPLYGMHNVANALAAFVVCAEFVGPDKLVSAFKNFQNSKKRFELVCHFNGAGVYNDYAHLPAEVSCAIEGARQFLTANSGGGKVVVAFQPHLQSRTKEHYQDFAKALLQADAVLLLPIFTPVGRAGENLGITHEVIYDEMMGVREGVGGGGAKKVVLAKDDSEFKPLLSDLVGVNDIVLLVGAGPIGEWYKRL